MERGLQSIANCYTEHHNIVMLKWPSLLNLCSASAFKMIIPVAHPDFQSMYVHAERCWDEFKLTW